MRLTCDGCGREFTAARSDARYCSGKCRTDAYRARKNPNAKPVRRRPITDIYTELVWSLERSMSRLERVGRDDRFDSAVRKGSIHTGQLANLQRRIGVLLGDDDQLDDEPMTDEEMNLAAGDDVHNYLGALVQTRSALRPGTVQYMVRRLRETADILDHPEAATDKRSGH